MKTLNTVAPILEWLTNVLTTNARVAKGEPYVEIICEF